MIYVFGEYTLHTTLYELRRVGGEPCKLEPQVFNVLVYLIQQRARVVPREELVHHLWPDIWIHDAVVTKYIMEARKAVGDNGQIQQVIKTIHSRGYRFIAPTVEYEDPAFPGNMESPVDPSQEWKPPLALDQGESSHHTLQDVFVGEQTVGTVICGTLTSENTRITDVSASVPLSTRHTFFAMAQQEGQRVAGTLLYFGMAGIILVCTQAAHAQRALHAALRLQERLQAPPCSGEALSSSPMALRYGMHTGPLPLSHQTEVPWCSSWTTADTTMIAIWLHYLACPGTLLSSQAALACLDATLPWVEHGLVHIPLQADPITTFRLG